MLSKLSTFLVTVNPGNKEYGNYLINWLKYGYRMACAHAKNTQNTHRGFMLQHDTAEGDTLC